RQAAGDEQQPLQRAYSMHSSEAIAGLQRTEEQLSTLEATAAEIMQRLEMSEITTGQARTELCQVEAKANKLMMDGVDGIYTGELTSGSWGWEKKAQISRLESLFDKLEGHFRVIKEADRAKKETVSV
ncbi:unnamed protein product, partial [Prorocentrum cordatum]